ncbi:MAG: radical SAM protein [Candidatus Tritonobacter lacicola]|nr:radical SAM protein [Candidatus Tritonobacter lacicola]
MKVVKNIVNKLMVRKGPPGENPLMEGIRDGTRAFCGPEQLHIDLTNRCNLTCIACWHRSPLLDKEDVWPHWNPNYELPLKRVLSLIDEAAAMGVRKVIYSGGGDSLLYRDIFKVLEHSTKKGLQVLLVSNLTMANEETIRRIAGSGITQLLVNLWAGTPSVYVATHPGTSERTFSRVVELLRLFAAARRGPRDPELIISNVVFSMNHGDIENMVRLAMEVGACDVWFQTVDVESDSLKSLLLSGEQIEELLCSLKAIKNKYEPLLKSYQKDILALDDFLEKLTNSRAAEGIYHSDVIDTMPCYMGWAECRILANGDVVPCCKADKHPLGNILDRSFQEVWDSRRYREFRRKAKDLSKTDPYFSRIKCAKVCDNWWFNKDVHRRYLDYVKKVGDIDKSVSKAS